MKKEIKKTLDVLMEFHSLAEEGTYTEAELENMDLNELEHHFIELVMKPYIEKEEAA